MQYLIYYIQDFYAGVSFKEKDFLNQKNSFRIIYSRDGLSRNLWIEILTADEVFSDDGRILVLKTKKKK